MKQKNLVRTIASKKHAWTVPGMQQYVPLLIDDLYTTDTGVLLFRSTYLVSETQQLVSLCYKTGTDGKGLTAYVQPAPVALYPADFTLTSDTVHDFIRSGRGI